MDAFFDPSVTKTNAGAPRDTFGDIINAQRKVSAIAGIPLDTVGVQRKASANAGATSTMHTFFAPQFDKIEFEGSL